MATEEKLTQCEKVLKLLKENRKEGVTAVQIIRNFILRPAARVWDLRHEGFDIVKKREPNGVARYFLISEPARAK